SPSIRKRQGQSLKPVLPRICRAVACHYSQTARAVSSVVERLVYTERGGGSNPSPPMFLLPTCDLPFATSGEHLSISATAASTWIFVVSRSGMPLWVGSRRI